MNAKALKDVVVLFIKRYRPVRVLCYNNQQVNLHCIQPYPGMGLNNVGHQFLRTYQCCVLDQTHASVG